MTLDSPSSLPPFPEPRGKASPLSISEPPSQNPLPSQARDPVVKGSENRAVVWNSRAGWVGHLPIINFTGDWSNLFVRTFRAAARGLPLLWRSCRDVWNVLIRDQRAPKPDTSPSHTIPGPKEIKLAQGVAPRGSLIPSGFRPFLSGAPGQGYTLLCLFKRPVNTLFSLSDFVL